MRHMNLAILFTGFALIPALASAADERPILPDTPSGFGDPSAIVCRAPQIMDGGQLGPQICGRNSEWIKLTAQGMDLAPDGETIIARPMVDEPKGDGNPDAVTCRKPQDLGGGFHFRQYGPEFCQTNGYWAKLKREKRFIAADGSLGYATMSASFAPSNQFNYNPGVTWPTPQQPQGH